MCQGISAIEEEEDEMMEEVEEDVAECETLMEERCGPLETRQYTMTQLCAPVPRQVCSLQSRVLTMSQHR